MQTPPSSLTVRKRNNIDYMKRHSFFWEYPLKSHCVWLKTKKDSDGEIGFDNWKVKMDALMHFNDFTTGQMYTSTIVYLQFVFYKIKGSEKVFLPPSALFVCLFVFQNQLLGLGDKYFT